MIDKDNTIVISEKPEIINKKTYENLREGQEIYGEKLAILSNHLWWDGKLTYNNETVKFTYIIYNSYILIKSQLIAGARSHMPKSQLSDIGT